MPTKQELLAQAREQRIEFVRLQFTDILGVMKNVAIPASQLERALGNEVMFDGSSIEGFTRVEESDMNLRPDLSTWAVLPWRPRVARLICDIHKADGTPFEGDPRFVLKRAVARANEMGFRMMVGPEIEFFLFTRSDDGKPTTTTHDMGGYFDLSPVDKGEDARREVVLALEEMGFEVETSHHEVAPGQHEVDFKYADALEGADRVSTFKLVTRTVAERHGLHATFMPKPIFGVNGSGMHCNISLFSAEGNAFYDPSGPGRLSTTARHFVGGLLKHAKAITAVTNPLVNSYKRMVPGYEAPVYVSWSASNRTALVRVPASREVGTRVELRSPDPSCNPYLAFAVILAAGLDGIRNQTDPPEPCKRNVFQMTHEERRREGIGSLPGNLKDALEELARSEVIRAALGQHLFEHFLEAKSIEWDVYRSQIHQWELDQYLGLF